MISICAVSSSLVHSKYSYPSNRLAPLVHVSTLRTYAWHVSFFSSLSNGFDGVGVNRYYFWVFKCCVTLTLISVFGWKISASPVIYPAFAARLVKNQGKLLASLRRSNENSLRKMHYFPFSSCLRQTDSNYESMPTIENTGKTHKSLFKFMETNRWMVRIFFSDI